MGFFSWQCKKCDHSIKSPYNLPTGWEYMNEVVYLREGHSPVIGEYDGYGRIEGAELSEPTALSTYEVNWEDNEPELWHKKCWYNEGMPQYSGESDYAEDQGFFYNDPTDEEMMEAINATK
jgi:hypothetical protein